MVAVRCPTDLEPLMRQAGGAWDPGLRHWLIERRRVGPLVRNLRRTVALSLEENPKCRTQSPPPPAW
jgi:hypothetical protein